MRTWRVEIDVSSDLLLRADEIRALVELRLRDFPRGIRTHVVGFIPIVHKRFDWSKIRDFLATPLHRRALPAYDVHPKSMQ